MVNGNLIKLQHFFEVDNIIKRELYTNAPPNKSEAFDDDSLCKYTNNLEKSLIYMFSELKCIALDIFGEDSSVLNRVGNLEQLAKQSFYDCGIDITKLRIFYQQFLSNMSESFIDEVKNNCVGYSLFNNIPIDMANSINEVLHLIHSYVLNNEYILQSVPVVFEKQNIYDYPICLRGTSTEVFNQVFEQFPLDLDVGFTDMVCLNEKKLLMMVRDRGHALTIEVTLNNNVARVDYFIPKLCNIDMINVLPGISNKVREDSVGAIGTIECDINNLSMILYDFISRVPMDRDMFTDNRIR